MEPNKKYAVCNFTLVADILVLCASRNLIYYQNDNKTILNLKQNFYSSSIIVLKNLENNP